MMDGDGGNAAIESVARFWERGRLVYNSVLAAVVLIWIVFSWPHFRPALTFGSLVVMLVLGLGANLCYCAAYLAEVAMRSALTGAALRRARQGLWVLGMIFALLLENYWIADEIYPNADHPPESLKEAVR